MQIELFPDYPYLPALPLLPVHTWKEDWKNFDYPFEDNQPMAQNPEQANMIIYLKSVIEAVTEHLESNCFVGVDVFVYYSKQKITYKNGKKRIKTQKHVLAPDIMLATGVAPHKRTSFVLEDEQARMEESAGKMKMLAIEIMSESNYKDKTDFLKRYNFYNQLGVDEYIIVHTKKGLNIEAFWRIGGTLQRVFQYENYIIDMLNISLNIENEQLVVRTQQGDEFLAYGNEREIRLQAQMLLQETKKQLKEYVEELLASEEMTKLEAKRADEEAKRAENAEKTAKTEAKRAENAEKTAKTEAKRADEEAKRAEAFQRELEELRNLLKVQKDYL